MVCNNRWAWAGLLLLSFSLFSCGGIGGKTKEAEPEKVEAATGENTVPAIVPIANPYLNSTQSVPAEAVKAFNSALVSMQSEEWAVAQQQLQEMTELYPQLSGPWVNLGIALWRQKQFDAAAQAFEQAIKVNPLNNDAYVQFAVMQREQGHFAEAEQLYLKALDVWPHNIEALINLGILYDMYMGRFQDALARFELAQKLVSEPSMELDGWIIDLKRRLSQ